MIAGAARRRRLVSSGLCLLWSVPVVVGVLAGPAATDDVRGFVERSLGPASGRYLGYAPMQVVAYLLAAQAVRGPLFLFGAAAAREQFAQLDTALGRGLALLRINLGWLVLVVSGALAVGAASGASMRAMHWALDIGAIVFLTGLPALASSTTLAMTVRRGWIFWTVGTIVLLVLAVFSMGFRAPTLPPMLPGTIDMVLMSGRDSGRLLAAAGAFAWPMLGWLAGNVLAQRTQRTRSGDDSMRLAE